VPFDRGAQPVGVFYLEQRCGKYPRLGCTERSHAMRATCLASLDSTAHWYHWTAQHDIVQHWSNAVVIAKFKQSSVAQLYNLQDRTSR
jgi:hypothetical protein